MSKKCFFSLAVCISVLLFLFSANLVGAEKMVSIATLDGYAPYTMLQPDPAKVSEETIAPGSDSKKLQGYSWDIVRESFHAMGYTIKLKVTPWARAMKEVKDGKYDVLMPTGFNEERAEIFNYSKEPINQANFVIYVLEDSDISWQGLSSLHDKKVAVRRGFNYGDKWNEHEDKIKTSPVNDVLTGFKMLKMGRVEGFAGYDINWDYALSQSDLDIDVKKLPPFGETLEYAVCLKSNPNGKTILQDFDAGKQKIIEQGIFEDIRAKWLD